MCELFGASFSVPADLRSELKEFYSHSVRHPHGWGVMRKNHKRYEIIKEPVRAIDSLILDDLVSATKAQTNMMAHIRLATVGSIKYANCHPFTGKDVSGREWILMHNGTIYSSKTLVSYLNKELGDTDSERIFLYLMDLLREEYRKTGSLTTEQRCQVVDRLTSELAPRNKLNLMIFDGEVLYVHKNMKDTLSMKQCENGVIFATTPLGENWEDMPICRLFAYREGQLIYTGKSQTTEFVPTLEYISAMMALNI